MADIKAFSCIHPAPGYAASIAALPYDVYSSAEAREAVKGKPLSFLRIDRPETQFPEGTDLYAPEVYRRAHDLLYAMLADGYLTEEKKDCYYLYELTMEGRSQTGIVACASLDDYQNGVIRRHENTREEKELDRIRHVDACSAQTGPIFLAYRNKETIRDITTRVKRQEPLFDFVSEDGIRHRGWCVDGEEEIEAIAQAFAQMDRIYIADGHHRAASAVKVGLMRRAEHSGYDGTEAFNYFLSVLFPDDELRILDYNRVVKDLNGYTKEEFLRRITQVCTARACREAVHPKQKGSFGMYLGGQWYALTAKEAYRSNDTVEGLDVSFLQREILQPILGIEDPKTSRRIRFVGGIRGLSELEKGVDSGEAVAFSLYPTSIAELFAVADAGKLMPPKSTWFEPKLRSGLFIHRI